MMSTHQITTITKINIGGGLGWKYSSWKLWWPWRWWWVPIKIPPSQRSIWGVGGGEKSHNIHCENYDDGDTNYDDDEGYPAKYHHHKLPWYGPMLVIITVGFFQNLIPIMLYWSCQFDDWNLKIVKFIFLSFTQTAGPGDFQCTQTPKQECSEKKCSYCTSL